MVKVTQEVNRQQQVQTHPERSQAPSRGGRGRWLLILLTLAGAILFFLPTLAGMALRSPETLAWISGQPAGTIEIGQARFTWQSPVELKNVFLHTPDGHALANVETLTSNQTFWGLLTQQKQKIKLNLDGVRYSVVVPEPGVMQVQESTDVSPYILALQDFNAPWPTFPMEVSVSNCEISFLDKDRKPIEEWNNISATYRYETNETSVQTIIATLPEAENQTGGMNLSAKLEREKDPQRTERLHLETSAQSLSLKPVAPWLDKYLGAGHGLTACTGQLQTSLNRDKTSGWSLTAQGQLNGPKTQTEAPSGQGAAMKLPGETTLQLESQFRKADDELSLSRFQLNADQAAVDLQGTIKQISGPQILQLVANIRAPGSAITDLIPPELRTEIQIEGAKFSQLEVTGALRPEGNEAAPPLTYSLIASWDRILAYGLDSKQGQLRVRYSGGQVSAEPIDVPISGGKLLMLPTLDLTTQPSTLRFRKGTILEGVELTEGVCRDWLMYISPTLAHATSANGRLSLVLNDGTLPLGEPERGDIGGVVLIREGAVRPGPLAIQMLHQVAALQALLNRGGEDLASKAILSMKKEDVPFRLYQGRVYHENFGANVGELRIATTGSMGLDQTLDMKLNISFPEKWLAVDRPVLRALAGAPIPIGIGGTLEEPRIDASGVADFGKQIGINAGVNLLEKILERRQQRRR